MTEVVTSFDQKYQTVEEESAVVVVGCLLLDCFKKKASTASACRGYLLIKNRSSDGHSLQRFLRG